ncbi:hypothetical protein NSERKGN1266_03770 [Nocardia seriolae]|nr:hypothetical protein NSERKGN1266_02970 [Nocardia seriolae]BEK84386.1 hypothetical protein NSERKGN1266_03370 [Nocardia seriolae]BEK84426.1 hypothetical protein NSERKGN1266_03770 [Nocardia seriolae]
MATVPPSGLKASGRGSRPLLREHALDPVQHQPPHLARIPDTEQIQAPDPGGQPLQRTVTDPNGQQRPRIHIQGGLPLLIGVPRGHIVLRQHRHHQIGLPHPPMHEVPVIRPRIEIPRR